MPTPAPPAIPATASPMRRSLLPTRLAWRLALGFGVLVGLMLLALALALWQLRSSSQQQERFATQDMQRLLRVQALSLITEGAGNGLLRLMNEPRAQRVPVYAEVDERNRRIDGIVAALDGQLDDAQQQQTLLRLMAARADYFQAYLATVDEIEANDSKAAMQAYTDLVQPALAHLLTLSNNLVNRERERLQAQADQTQQHLNQLALWVLAASLLAVVLATALALGTTRSVAQPMQALEKAAQQIAAGNYAVAMPVTGMEEVNRVTQALGQMSQAIAERELQIERLAFRDPLTDLPNRTYLQHMDRPALPNGRVDATLPSRPTPPTSGCGLLLLDLARLKAINETLGFGVGDLMIQQVAQRTQAVLHRQATAPGASPMLLAHVSGGSFAIFTPAAERATLLSLQQLLVSAMATPVVCGEHSVDLSLTFGLADAPAGQCLPLLSLLRNAEVALHAAKQTASPLAWYNPAQEAARLSHLGLLSDLRQAVAQSQLQMWLQPKFSLRTGQAVGAEALVRWQHPQRGFVSPAEFVPFAEQTGAITQVTDWMLAQALHTLQQWQARGCDLSISVNISTRDLQETGFAQKVQGLLQHYRVEPQRLNLEIVESGLMHDTDSSIALLHQLRDMGVKLSIDDFGTGYSSLAYLQRLPVSELKIDRSFIIDIDAKPASQRLVKSMIDMGHGLDLLVTAEGIETEAERQTLRQLGCDVVQGYLTSRPVHGVALQTWLEGVSGRAITENADLHTSR